MKITGEVNFIEVQLNTIIENEQGQAAIKVAGNKLGHLTGLNLEEIHYLKIGDGWFAPVHPMEIERLNGLLNTGGGAFLE